MNKYIRHADDQISGHFSRYREVLILLGARQVGKTTLLKKIFPKALYLLVDNESVRENLERYDISVYRQILPADVRTIVIDEIHLLSDPGRAAKIIYDQMPDVRLVITGSSSLEIKNRSTESLAGRKIEYHLYPLTFSEYLAQKGIEKGLNYKILENIIGGDNSVKKHLFDAGGILKNILIYGLYPAMTDKPGDRIYLQNLADSVIFKDLIDLHSLENRATALNLLKLLAYQVGSLVNISELGNRLQSSTVTVNKYLRIFEESFIIFPLRPFSQKGRDEIGKMSKYYFYDLGLRNALIGDFSSPVIRRDYGALFENFIIAEIIKINNYGNFGFKLNFWRNKQGSEIDLILRSSDSITGVEIKTNKERINRAFQNRYPHAKLLTINPENFY